MPQTLKRVDPLSLAKILGLGYAAMGLLFLPFALIGPLLFSLAPETQQSGASPGIFLGLGLGFALLMPVFYGVMGFIIGLISAFAYNLLAKWVGGIEFELE